MKNNIFIAKQGLLLKLISILFQNLLILPVSLLLSFIISSVLLSYVSIASLTVFKLIFIILNIAWIIRNSLVKVQNDAITVRTIIGTKQTIEFDNISDLKQISFKELRNIIFNTKSVDPLITNCAVFLIPMGKFLCFKNKFGRTVTIGVWNCDKLYSILCENTVQSTDEKAEINSAKSQSISNSKTLKCFIKMSIGSHISTYFKCFYSTILFPLFIVLFISLAFGMADISVNMLVRLLLFAVISAVQYIQCIKVVVDGNSKTIRLNIFPSNNKNVIKIDNISNLKKGLSTPEADGLKKDKSRQVICTPYNKSNDIIEFALNNNTYVILSVDKPQELFEILQEAIGKESN